MRRPILLVTTKEIFFSTKQCRCRMSRIYPHLLRSSSTASSDSFSSSFSSSSSSSSTAKNDNNNNNSAVQLLQPQHRTHLIFGANTDVGKTIITTGLIRASLLRPDPNHIYHPHHDPPEVHYIKPLQCGSLDTGGDQGFVERYVANLITNSNHKLNSSNSSNSISITTTTSIPRKIFTAQTLFRWSTATSPHAAAFIENNPVSDTEVLQQLHQVLQSQQQQQQSLSSQHTTSATTTTTYIETAGGVLSPSASSPHNHHPQRHVRMMTSSQQQQQQQQQPQHQSSWGWTVQGDLYRQSSILMSRSTSVILIGDGRLGGISSTISAMESLLLRGYDIVAILFLEPSSISSSSTTPSSSKYHHTEGTNVQAIRDYVTSRQLRSGNGERLFPFPQQSIVSLPSIPQDPNIPLYDWYESPIVQSIFQNIEHYLSTSWEDYIYDLRSTVHSSHNSNPIWIPGSTDPSCRRFFVHTTAINNHHTDTTNNSNSSSSGSASLQVIHSSSLSSSSSSATDPPTNQENHEQFNGPSSPFSSTISTPATTTTTSTTNMDQLECQTIIDASGSWWTQSGILSENYNTSMVLALAATASRYGGHISGTPPASCMIHTPLLLLSQTIQGYHKPWATQVYYTDDGGTSAVEVAIKMGFRTYQQRMNVSPNDMEQTYWIVAAQEGCYHGDTLGAMNIMEWYVSTEHPWYQERSLCLSTPTIGYQDGTLSITLPHGMTTSDDVTYTFDSIPDVMDIHVRSLSPKLLSLYKEIIEMQWLAHEHRTQQKIGCAILEPLLQCASGMKFVDPLWQAAMVDVAQSRNIPVIFDESTTGMYRLGIRSASQILLRNPDIVIHSKLLTGGIVPLSAIVTNKSVYDACVDVEFLYGNTLVANPISCASALYALSMYDTYQKQRVDDYTGRTIKHSSQPYLLFDEDRVRQLSLLPSVKQSFTLGSILTITLHSNNDDNPNDIEANDIALQLVQSLLDRQSILLGLNQVNYTSDVVYIMVPPFTSRDVCNRITDIVYRAIQELQL